MQILPDPCSLERSFFIVISQSAFWYLWFQDEEFWPKSAAIMEDGKNLLLYYCIYYCYWIFYNDVILINPRTMDVLCSHNKVQILKAFISLMSLLST